jgi:uncharacterized membrane protein YkvA (DUF1232 family)
VPLKVTFELSDADLRHFRNVAKTARESARHQPEKKTIANARKLLRDVKAATVPGFIRDRLLLLEKFIRMLEDADWALTGANRERIVSALAYFNEPVDLIPDSVPGIGFLDDAIMVQLVVDDLNPDIEAYDDFCAFRRKMERAGAKTARAPHQQASLESRRAQLHARMRRRRARRGSRREAGTAKRPFSLW